jgi:hypothetical protein
VEYVYAHILVAHLLFQRIDFSHCHQVPQVVFQAEVALALMEVHLCLCTSSMTAESVLLYFGKEGGHTFDFHKSLPGVFLSPPSPFHT